MRFLPTRVHGMIDYPLGVFLIAAPWIFGFADAGPNAWLTFVVIGVVAIVAGACTENSTHPAAEPARGSSISSAARSPSTRPGRRARAAA
jgi:hypothetical protein